MITGITPTATPFTTGPFLPILSASLGVGSATQLDGATITVVGQSEMDIDLARFMSAYGLTYAPVPVVTGDEAIQQLQVGAADVLLVPVDWVDRVALDPDWQALSDFSDGAVQRGSSIAESLEGQDRVRDLIDAKGGDDTVRGGMFNDTIYGDEGNDLIFGDQGEDVIYAGPGDDRVFAGIDDDQSDEIYGEAGNDTLAGGGWSDSIYGGDGDDVIYGGDSTDRLFGEDGNDVIWGGDRSDQVRGGAGNDTLGGGLDADDIDAGDGNDVIYGGRDAGNDSIQGEGGDDLIFSGDGLDRIGGGDGNDEIFSGASNDFVLGGAGNDTLWGGGGNDVFDGDEGADVFAFTTGNGSDSVRDFERGTDKIAIYGGATSFADLSFDDPLFPGRLVTFADVQIAVSGTNSDGTALQTLSADDFLFF